MQAHSIASKMTATVSALVIATLALSIAGPSTTALARGTPLGTAFTYQGRLEIGGSPASGLHDMRFRLYDTAAGATQIGSTLCANNVSVADGLFTVPLNFGALAFDGNERFLEIDVRADTGLDCGSPAGFTVLGPRQPITAAPYASFALQSLGAANATQLNSQPASFYTNAANLSTGTLADARLSGNVGLLNAAQTFTGVKTFSAAPSFTAGAAPFAVSSTALVTNLNADRLDGLNSTAFLQAVPNPLALSGSIAGSIIRGENASSSGRGVVGHASASTGFTHGVEGQSDSPDGRGVYGVATAGSGFSTGGYFVSGASTSGTGVFGAASAATGSTSGVWGQSDSTNGTGVFGWALAGSGNTYGGRFQSDSTSGTGVYGAAASVTGSTYGGRFDNASTSGTGVWALTTAGTGFTTGGFFQSNSTSGTGVFGYAGASTGTTHGVQGRSESTDGRGVFGLATAGTGVTYGGVFESDSPSGTGVYGLAAAGSGTTYGVRGESDSTSGAGVFGSNDAAVGITFGGRFESASNAGIGVLGIATAGTGATSGGRFDSASPNGRGVLGHASASSGVAIGGVFDSASTSGVGVSGFASAGTGATDGVRGESVSTTGRGVFGSASAVTGANFGGRFESNSTSGVGVFGAALAATGPADGGRFQTSSTSGFGVWGLASAATGATYGVLGQVSSASASAFAVFGSGNMGCSGTKPFRIDHPDDPTNKYLLHYSIESPEVLNAYSGKATLNGAGEAMVDLPLYFAKINRDPRYTLTAIGAPMPNLYVADEISEGALVAGGPCWFRIAGGAPGEKVSWRVEALRNDAWVRSRGAPVEVDKPEHERGKYQHPDLYGQPPEMGMTYTGQAGDRAAAAATPLPEDALPRNRLRED